MKALAIWGYFLTFSLWFTIISIIPGTQVSYQKVSTPFMLLTNTTPISASSNKSSLHLSSLLLHKGATSFAVIFVLIFIQRRTSAISSVTTGSNIL